MTYKSLQEIEDRYVEPENETSAARKRRLDTKNRAIKNFNERQASQSQTPSRTTRTTASATQRKQQSRAVQADEPDDSQSSQIRTLSRTTAAATSKK